MPKQKVFTVSIKDCEIQTFCAGGKGGQRQNKTETGVRIVHPPSGAVGESREHAKQIQNKRAAFKRMGQSKKFQTWAKINALKLEPIEDIVDKMMQEENLKIEYF